MQKGGIPPLWQMVQQAHHPELVEGEGPFGRLTAMSFSNGRGRFSEQYVRSIMDSFSNVRGPIGPEPSMVQGFV
jgi:hypothetical protein